MTDQADKPIPLSQDELTTIGKVLPAGSTILGGVRSSNKGSGASTFHAGDCVLVFYCDDNHGIHRAEVCGGGTDYEIVSDEVVGSW